MKAPHTSDTPIERLSGSVERVTFHSEESGLLTVDVDAGFIDME